ncbi:olfactory receptor 1J4-like [Ahaetulla prasina]|uniref:olfactory receptor 1J4-like n=1 Tax=Ahaetulla prasina TaxID=499056 RepID=UPI002647A178|nr:olfactory receptor 1J4-like [Ahaetulla prasina]
MKKHQENQTNFAGFILLGFSSSPDRQGFLFLIFLFMYLLCVLGNLLIILLIFSNASLLYAPMYLFLSHLSLADIGFTSSIVPKMLQSLVSQSNTISFSGCLTQLYFFVIFCTTDNLLLTSMAYDRYVAICRPLYYARIMNYKCALRLAATSWLLAHAHSLLYVLLVSDFTFCNSQEIPHFFCDVHPLLKLTCSDTSLVEMVLVSEGSTALLGPLLFILLSYIFIIFKVMKIPSRSGKFKAFSTCSAHLTTVTLFYGSLMGTYLRPSHTYSGSQLKVASIVYTVVTPLLNPFIYSLRNSEIHTATKKLFRNWFQKN